MDRRIISSINRCALVLVLWTLGTIAPGIVSGQLSDNGILPGINRRATLDEHLFIQNLTTAVAPRIGLADDYIVFSYRDNDIRRPRHVSMAFEHEEFARFHTMHVNHEGVFFYFLPFPTAVQARREPLRYRLIVDGVWMHDPANPQTQLLRSGVRLSVVDLPAPPAVPVRSPVVGATETGLQGRGVRFVFEAAPNAVITLAGSFNGWDPFMYRLQPVHGTSNLYEFGLRLLPGEYRYVYYIDGRRVIDPLNPAVAADPERGRASVLLVR